MTGFFVRDSVATDDAEIRAIVGSARKESNLYRGAAFDAPMGQDRITLVAGTGESVFGALVASRTDHEVWTIHVVHVLPDARGVGLGNMLVEAVIDRLRARGASRIESGAQPGDRALKNLFESHAIVARTIIVGRSL